MIDESKEKEIDEKFGVLSYIADKVRSTFPDITDNESKIADLTMQIADKYIGEVREEHKPIEIILTTEDEKDD